MSQGYHTNAKTNLHSREIIQQSSLTNIELSERFEIDEKTVSKWKNRDVLTDKSSRPHTIQRSLTDIEREVIRSIGTNSLFRPFLKNQTKNPLTKSKTSSVIVASRQSACSKHIQRVSYYDLTAACIFRHPQRDTGPLDIHRLTLCGHYSRWQAYSQSIQLAPGSARVQATLLTVLMHANGVSNQSIWLRCC